VFAAENKVALFPGHGVLAYFEAEIVILILNIQRPDVDKNLDAG